MSRARADVLPCRQEQLLGQLARRNECVRRYVPGKCQCFGKRLFGGVGYRMERDRKNTVAAEMRSVQVPAFLQYMCGSLLL